MFTLFIDDDDKSLLYLVGSVFRGGFEWEELRVYYSFQSRQYYVGLANGCSCYGYEYFFDSLASFRTAGSLSGVVQLLDNLELSGYDDSSHVSRGDVVGLKGKVRDFDSSRGDLLLKFRGLPESDIVGLFSSYNSSYIDSGRSYDDLEWIFVNVFKKVFQGDVGYEPYRVIVAGSRDFDNYGLLCKFLDRVLRSKIELGFSIRIVSGLARGADSLAVDYAVASGFEVDEFPADWDFYGKKAGYVRNQLMAENADALVAFTNGSKGTEHMINIAKDKGLPIRVVYVDNDSNYVSVDVFK